MSLFICRCCGTQYAESAPPPPSCPVCEDDRQYVCADGQAWTTLEDLRRQHAIRWEAEDAGVTGIGMEPRFAIPVRALLVETQHGNILWDCVALVNDDVVQRIKARGGVIAIAISHPHFYTGMVEWSRALGGVPIHLHADDRAWVRRPDEAIVHWSGDTNRLTPDATLIRCGGHFPGSTVLHWAGGAEGKGAVFVGDTLNVTEDRKHFGFMHSYPNFVPLNAAAVSRIRAAMDPFRFERAYGWSWRRTVMTGARDAFLRSIDRTLRAIDAGSPTRGRP